MTKVLFWYTLRKDKKQGRRQGRRGITPENLMTGNQLVQVLRGKVRLQYHIRRILTGGILLITLVTAVGLLAVVLQLDNYMRAKKITYGHYDRVQMNRLVDGIN